MWVVENPDINATGFSRALPEGRGKTELQLEPLSFTVMVKEEVDAWLMVPKFAEAEKAGRILVYETDVMPNILPELPARMRPDRSDDLSTARQIVWCPTEELHSTYLDIVNLFKAKPESGRDWDTEANTPYLRTRHRQTLEAAIWMFENVASKMRTGLSAQQKERLAACKRQLKLIEKLV